MDQLQAGLGGRIELLVDLASPSGQAAPSPSADPLAALATPSESLSGTVSEDAAAAFDPFSVAADSQPVHWAMDDS